MTTNLYKNILYIPSLFVTLVAGIRRQKKFLNEILEEEIEKEKTTVELSKTDIKKMKYYYGLGVPAILGESFCLLQGKKMSSKEREASTYQGALTGLLDDLFDENNTSDTNLRALIENPHRLDGNTPKEKLVLHFFRKALANSDDESMTTDYALQVLDYQNLSKGQSSTSLSDADIQQITYKKGGFSLLFYRSVFHPRMDTREEKLLFRIGSFMQLGNDIFDVYEDTKKGIKTLVNTAERVEDVRKTYKKLMEEMVTLSYETHYSRKKITYFLRFIVFGASRVFVCLDQLEKLQQSSNHIFTPEKYSRKQLICDMEKPLNILRSLLYYAKFSIER